MGDRVYRILITIFVIAYAILPDPVPGPIDDIIVIIIGHILKQRVAVEEKA